MILVTAAIIEHDGLVFAARRKQGTHLAGFWELPGGKIEGGEPPEICLARELHEEFGVEVAVGAFFGESVFDYDGKVIKLLAYLVSHLRGEFRPVDHDKVKWLPVSRLHTLKWAPADIPLIEKYQRCL